MAVSRRTFLKGAVAGAAGLVGASVAFRPSASAETPGLRVMADRLGMRIGTWLNDPNLPEVAAIQSREFNLGSVWRTWGRIESARGVRDYRSFDALLQRADRVSMQKFGYNLVNPRLDTSLPSWLPDLESRGELIFALSSFVSETVARSRGKMYAWNIVCESQHPKGDFLRDAIGLEYLEIAFQAARTADPALPICYVDYNNFTTHGSRYRLTKDIVDHLKTKSLIDAVGIEGIIIATDPPTYDELVTAFQSYGVPVIITEFAVLLHGLDGTSESKYQKQAEIYATVLRAAIDSGVCKDFYVQTIVDKFSSWEDPSAPLSLVFPDQDPCPYDDNFQPKPAYYAMASVLQKAVDAKLKYRARLPMLALDR